MLVNKIIDKMIIIKELEGLTSKQDRATAFHLNNVITHLQDDIRVLLTKSHINLSDIQALNRLLVEIADDKYNGNINRDAMVSLYARNEHNHINKEYVNISIKNPKHGRSAITVYHSDDDAYMVIVGASI